MSTTHALLLAPGEDVRHDRDVMPYLWSDLLPRRVALGLQLDDVAELLGVDWDRYARRENGNKRINEPGLIEEMAEMEAFVAEASASMISAAPSAPAGAIVLRAFEDQETFVAAHPKQRTLAANIPYPVLLHHVAIGRAAAALTRDGRTVEIFRGDRRADLACRRLAVGLTKGEAGPFFGLKEKKYYEYENGARTSDGLIAEFQAVDDFITRLISETSVAELEGVAIVPMFDDETDFAEQYPDAQTLRSGRPYPMRFGRVAAGRLAGALEAGGKEVRIIASTRDPMRRSNRGTDSDSVKGQF